MTTASALDKLVGRTLGAFVLRERIGEGGFGAVYRAIQPELDREAVVKVLHTRLKAAKAMTERFLREARLASKLDHPYAAHVYAFGAEPDGELWIAMELVRGTPLDEVLRVQGPLPLERYVPLLDRVCEVVRTAHEQGIVHRDLKPANVMVLARAGRLLPKLLDFGIAKALERSATDPGLDDTRPGLLDPAAISGAVTAVPIGTATGEPGLKPALTQRGAVMGSPLYMAPEQWLDAGRVDSRTDQYALGVMSYEILTGAPPFPGDTLTAIATAHATGAPPPLGPRFPDGLDAVFARVLAKKPEDRYPDVLAFAAAVRSASGLGTDAPSLPAIDQTVREAAMSGGAPQPIAEAIAAIEAARNLHQARDAAWQVVRTVVRWLALVGLACRSKVTAGREPPVVAETLRALHKRGLSDGEWLELARELTRPWVDRRDAYPVPELIDAFHASGDAPARVALLLEDLLAQREATAAAASSDAVLHDMLKRATAALSRLLPALGFLAEYQLVVMVGGGIAERWMGVRRAQRTTTAVRGRGLAAGVPALLDRDGVPVVALHPLIQVAAPTPSAPLDLFLFDGRGRRGARLVALPLGFEHHDDALWDWFRTQLADSVDETETTAAEERPPYRGLSAFSADDGAVFFGREKLVDAVMNRLRVQPLITIVGRSGAGKSSFVHAGVIPSLPAGWRTLVMRPGAAPLAALSARLQNAGLAAGGLRADLADDRHALGDLLRADARERGPILLVIDQLEEMFTLCHDEAERRQFADGVADAARTADDPVRVVFTLRDDFLVRAEQIAALRNRLGHSLQLLTVPVAEDLHRILVEPARRAGYEFEDPELPHEMVKEIADQPGALALLSFTAANLWELRDRQFRQLTRKAYRSLGGVGGALAQHAERTLEAMTADERRLTREAFRHLVTSSSSRAVLARGDLRQLLGGNHADTVIEKLVAARLLVASEDETGGDLIEIIHEALLSAWPRLAEWRREDAEGARLREQLRSAAKQWQDRDRPRGLLWRGDPLADLQRWRSRHGGPLTDAEAAFAEASVRDAARGRRVRRGLAAAAFTVLAAGVVVLLSLNTKKEDERRRAAFAQSRAEASDQKSRAQVAEVYEEQGRQYFLAEDPIRALVYLVAARDAGADDPALRYLTARASALLAKRVHALAHDGTTRIGRYTADGRHVITAGDDGMVYAWDAATGARAAAFTGHQGTIFYAEISRDGTRLITAGLDKTARIWDLASGRQLHVLAGHDALVATAHFSRDGRRAITASPDATVRIWDATSGAAIATLRGHDGWISDAVFTADASVAYSAGADDHTLRRWNLATGTATTLSAVGTRQALLALSPDGTLLAAGTTEGTVEVWDTAGGRRQRAFDLHGQCNGLAFDASGRRLVGYGADAVDVWNVATGDRVVSLRGHHGDVVSAVFSPDGARVATACTDGNARVWEATTGQLLAVLPGIGAGLWVAIAPDGRRIASGGTTAPEIWDARADVLARTVEIEPGAVVALARGASELVSCAPDGTLHAWRVGDGAAVPVAVRGPADCQISATLDGDRLALVGAGGITRIVDPDGYRQLVETVGVGRANAAAFSPDGAQVATAYDDQLAIWNTRDGAAVAPAAHSSGTLYAATWSPDARAIAACGRGGAATVWDVASHTSRALDIDGVCGAIAFTADSKRLLAASNKDVEVWRSATGDRERTLDGHTSNISAVFDAAGLVISTSLDRTARVWDARTGRLLDVFPHPDVVASAALDRDRRVLVTSAGARAFVWELASGSTQPTLPAALIESLPFVVRDGLLVPRQVH